MRRVHERQPAGPALATPPSGGGRAGARLCVLLACFPGAKRAANVRKALGKQITGPGELILDEVIVRVNSKRRVQVYDPRRVLAGTLTPALTWGVFGLLSSGVASGGVWAIVGAICGGSYAYYTEHLLTRNELRRLGSRLSGDSSSIVAFVQGGDGKRMLSVTGSFQPATASVAEIGADLSAQVAAGAGQPARTSSAPPGGGPLPTTTSDVLSMLLLRYRGTDTANHELARTRPAHHKEREAVEPEMVFRAPEHGRLKAGDPKQGVAAMAKSSIISWGVFVSVAFLTGLIWVICDSAGLPVWSSALIAFVVGYTIRVPALYFAWEEPLAKEPKGVYLHDDGRPMLGRKLKGKSAREMASLGLSTTEPGSG